MQQNHRGPCRLLSETDNGGYGSGTVRRFAAMTGRSAATAVIAPAPVKWRYRPRSSRSLVSLISGRGRTIACRTNLGYGPTRSS